MFRVYVNLPEGKWRFSLLGKSWNYFQSHASWPDGISIHRILDHQRELTHTDIWRFLKLGDPENPGFQYENGLMLVWGYPYLGNNLHINSLRNWYPKKTQFSGRIWRRSCLDPCGQGTTKEFPNHMIGKGDSLLIMGCFIHWIWLLPTKVMEVFCSFSAWPPRNRGWKYTTAPANLSTSPFFLVPNMCKSPTELLPSGNLT